MTKIKQNSTPKRIRVTHRGYVIDMWQVYSKYGRIRRALKVYFDRPTYSYRVTTPDGTEIIGKEFRLSARWKTKEQILDGLLKRIEREKSI